MVAGPAARNRIFRSPDAPGSGRALCARARADLRFSARMSLGLLITLSLALGVAAWLFFMWTVKSGQYDDPEGPKYRMLEDDEGEAPPVAKGGSGETPRGKRDPQ